MPTDYHRVFLPKAVLQEEQFYAGSKVAIGSVRLKMVDRLGKSLFLYSNKLCDKLTTQKKKENIWRSTLEAEQLS